MLTCVYCHGDFTREQSTEFSREQDRLRMVALTGNPDAEAEITGRGGVVRNMNHEIIKYINIWCPYCGQEQLTEKQRGLQ